MDEVMSDQGHPPLSIAFPGEGEMVRAVNEKDWSRTLLGPQTQWPEAIRSAVALCLNSEFQLVVLVGPGLVYIYNDASIRIFGNKHPAALGRRVQDVWPEAWETLGPLLKGVLETGLPCRNDDQLLGLNRAGFAEECYFTSSFSPIHTGPGTIGGVFVAVLETTRRVLSERRQCCLGDLATRLAQHRGAHGSLDLVREALASNPYDFPMAALYLTEGASARQVLCSGLRAGGERIPQVVDWPGADGGNAIVHPLAQLALSGEPALLDAAIVLDENDCCGVWPELPRQLLAVPLMLGGSASPRGFLLVALNPRVQFDENYRRFIHTTVGLVATAVASVDAYEAEQRRIATLAELDRSRSQFSALHAEVAAIRDDFAQVIEGTNDAFVSYDRQLRIRSLNGAAAKAFGDSPARLIGRSCFDAVPELAGTALGDALLETAARGRATRAEYYDRALDCWYDVRVLPAPYGSIVFGTDITERKLAEQAMLDANVILEHRVQARTRDLLEANRLVAAVFDRAPGGIAITSVDGVFVRTNAAYASMLGYADAELVGRTLAGLVNPVDYRAAAPALLRLLSGELSFHETEMRFHRKSGEAIWVLSFLSVVEGGPGHPLFFVHVAKDVTRRRELEAERRAEQDELKILYRRLETVREAERTALAREVHDQLGQTLSATKIDLRLLEDAMLAPGQALAPAEVARELRSASATLDRALQIVRHIATELRAPALDGQGLYAALEWHARDFQQRTRILARLELGEGLPRPVRAVAEALLRIFQEALTNVLRHAHAGEVQATLERRGTRLLLRVRDDGVGIARARGAGGRSLGLTGMRERAVLVQGRLLVGPLRSGGTLVSALVPIDGGGQRAGPMKDGET
ncbi:MAG: PAS domain-containing protein [Telluria sp.]